MPLPRGGWIVFVCLLLLLAGGSHCALASPEKPKIDIREIKQDGHTFVVGTTLIDSPRETVWRVLTDYERATRVFANLSKSEVLERQGNTVKLHQIVKPGYFPFTFDYVVDMKALEPESIEWHRVSGSFDAYDGAWKLEKPREPEHSNCTRVTYQVYLDANKFIPQWLLRRSLKGYMPEVFDSVRRELKRQKTAFNG
ncbi:MAG: hypothetical protein JST01_26610 [Cyanobacteria bacterium SZAS TMP-1]|nr:hypothetical protein [Cyanobacteria bacterium SZAS TMP-1]